jgi:hypothetical protein
MMTQPAVRNFQITPNQYELFRFTVSQPTTLHIRMEANAPVNLVLLDSDERADYESSRNATHSYSAAWGRRRELETDIKVRPGTWYLAVEGSTEPSRGRIEVFQ